MSLDEVIYVTVVTLISAMIAYVFTFRVLWRTDTVHINVPHTLTPHPVPHAAPRTHAPQEKSTRSFSAYEGFKSFARNAELTVEDIVKGLSRE